MKTKENKSWVFLFGGQGSQKPGMGIDIFEAYPGKGYFHGHFCCREEMVFLLDPEFKNLNETLYAQLALTVFGLTVLDLLKEAGIEPGAALGLSAGEFPALAAASASIRLIWPLALTGAFAIADWRSVIPSSYLPALHRLPA